MLTHPRQELYRMGILYDVEDVAQQSNAIASEVPFQQASPLFIPRQRKPRPSRRRSTWRSLPLYLSLSNLKDDADIARFLSPTAPPTSIQHRKHKVPLPQPLSLDIPQSLPPVAAPALTESPTNIFPNTPISTSPTTYFNDWEFINNISTPTHPPETITPSSEPETWIFLSDDS
ncbi:hypothetical protein G7Y89_g169 [Cudoniella acicularis]|uniref:Uncharacterized protein n=1 Tax=Cudoniella acicularis TaxID=354080 RepID=A0A8H4RZ88_9HELO|nr:hypothetical protein G7Y89_g169 [Cudoniella acicularis]